MGEVVAFLPVSLQHDVPGTIETIEIPGGTYAATVHRGPYADLDRTYGVLGGYVASKTAPTAMHVHKSYAYIIALFVPEDYVVCFEHLGTSMQLGCGCVLHAVQSMKA